MPLTAEGLTHYYRAGAAPVLRDVSLSIDDGTTLAIVGPSGSGKTTLLAILGLLISPTEGRVLIDGSAVTPRDRRASSVRASLFGWVFQTVNVLVARTVLDNAALGLLARGQALHAARERAFRSLESVGLAAMAERPANTLSGGEVQRLCIARAIAVEPRFLLADEPTGQLDRSTTEEVLRSLMSARPPHTALVVVTHDPSVASRCDQVVALDDGRLVPGREVAP